MLKAKDVYLSPLLQEDAQTLFSWINDRDNVLYSASYKPISEQQHFAWFNSLSQRNDIVIFGIRLEGNDSMIGSCQLHSIDRIHRNAELQIRIGEVDQQDKGFGEQAAKLLLDFAFCDLNLERIYLHVFETNERAINMYKKSGFIHEGVLRKHAYISGNYLNVVMMGLLRNEFKK